MACDLANISKVYTVLSHRVIITRSWCRKIRFCEITIGGKTPKRVQLGHSRVPSNGWNFIGNKYFLLLQPRTPLERLVRRYRYRLHGLHRFAETFPRNITFLSIELNAQIHPRGLRFSISEFSFAFTVPTPLYRLVSGSRSASLGKALNPPTSRKPRWYYHKCWFVVAVPDIIYNLRILIVGLVSLRISSIPSTLSTFPHPFPPLFLSSPGLFFVDMIFSERDQLNVLI